MPDKRYVSIEELLGLFRKGATPLWVNFEERKVVSYEHNVIHDGIRYVATTDHKIPEFAPYEKSSYRRRISSLLRRLWTVRELD